MIKSEYNLDYLTLKLAQGLSHQVFEQSCTLEPPVSRIVYFMGFSILPLHVLIENVFLYRIEICIPFAFLGVDSVWTAVTRCHKNLV